MSPTYFATVSPTYIENWPNPLHQLSIPQVDIPLSLEETRRLGRNIWHFGKWFGNTPRLSLDSIAEKIRLALLNFPKGAFIRLGSRSAKDSYYAKFQGLRITQAEEALKMLTQSSERVAFDLRLALQHHYCPHIFVRQWFDIPKWAEFRCFMRERKLIGISQYDCKNLGHCPEISEHAESIKFAIAEFFKEFRVASHLENVVFDVFILQHHSDQHSSAKVKLLELNPFSPKTDACLFSWCEGGNFDGTFKIL